MELEVAYESITTTIGRIHRMFAVDPVAVLAREEMLEEIVKFLRQALLLLLKHPEVKIPVTLSNGFIEFNRTVVEFLDCAVRGDFERVEKTERWIKETMERATRVNNNTLALQENGPLVGIEEDVQLIVSRLMTNRDVNIVFIVGVKGTGKTTLAKSIYNSPVVVRSFPRRAWVNVPQPQEEFDSFSISLDIMAQLEPLELDQSREEEWIRTIQTPVDTPLMGPLFRSGADPRPCLIFLDDVRTPEAWETLQTALMPALNRIGSGRFKILVTTPCRNLAQGGPGTFVLEKRLLSDLDCWELFNVKLGFTVPDELIEIGQEMCKKCMGLPLAVFAVAELLSKRAPTREQWSTTLQQINQEQVSLYCTSHTDADALPANLKKCLFYFGLFHENYEIPVRRLIALWVAEGLAQSVTDGKESPERVAMTLLTDLIGQNMIQVAKKSLNGKEKTCRMNYLLRDKWLSEARKANFLRTNATISKSSRQAGKIFRLVDHLDSNHESFSHIHGNNDTSRSTFRSHYKDFHSFLSFDSREGPVPGEEIGNFLHKCIAWKCHKILRVLDLEGVFRPRLPESLGKLTQLRYLGLRWTYLEKLPSTIGKLLNLQTLDLKHTNISSLPSSLWKMQQLRHVHLSETNRCRFLPPPGTNFTIDIQTLNVAFVDEETPIKDGLDRLINLRKLGLSCRLTPSQQQSLAEWIKKLYHLESLKLRSVDDLVQPSSLYLETLSGLNNLSSIYLVGMLENPVLVQCLPESLTEITLAVSKMVEDPMPKLEKLPNLRILNLFASAYIGKIMVCSSGGFPLLRALKLWKLEELEEWVVEEGALTILKEVEIRGCKQLKEIPDGFKHLKHCHELKLTKMPGEFMERLIENQGQDWNKIAHVPYIVRNNGDHRTASFTRI